MTPNIGDRVVHLDHGLATVTAVPITAGIPQIVVAANGEHWIPASAWAAHLAPLPSRADAEAWRAANLAADRARTEASSSAALRRGRMVRSRDLSRMLDALRDAYASGDRSADAIATLDRLEGFVLPILGHVLDIPPATLSADLRAAMPEAARLPPEAPLAKPRDDLDPIGRATLSTFARVGDLGDDSVNIATRPGPWSAWMWSATRDGAPAVIALHDDAIPRALELVRACREVGEANTECAQVSIRDEAVDNDPILGEEFYDPIEPGLVARRGWAISNGGDGPYHVWAANDEDGDAICVIAGGPFHELALALLRGADRESAATHVLHEWIDGRGNEDEEVDRVACQALEILGTLPPTERILEVLQKIALVDDRDDNREVRLDAVMLLARTARDPMPWFQQLVDQFEKPSLAFSYRIDHVLARSQHRGPGDLALARLAANVPPWPEVRIHKLQALAAGDHPAADAAIRALWHGKASRWTRAHMAVLLLRRDPTSCEVARSLIELADRYEQLDASGDPPNSGFGRDWDQVCEVMRAHVAACPSCKTGWIEQLERASTTMVSRRFSVLAADELRRIMGPARIAG